MFAEMASTIPTTFPRLSPHSWARMAAWRGGCKRGIRRISTRQVGEEKKNNDFVSPLCARRPRILLTLS